MFCASPALAFDFAGTIGVIDGDTVDVGQVRVRLYGIDAPERGQPCTTKRGQHWACGDWVTRQVNERYHGKAAQCDVKDVDRYGRQVARCFVGGEDIGRRLVRDGLAFAYRKYAMDYDLDEHRASAASRGLHAYTVQSPGRYRLTARSGQVAPDPNCRIKGNVSARGTRIYHLPGQLFYERTRIRSAAGERWFCSEAQARASGWRAARR